MTMPVTTIRRFSSQSITTWQSMGDQDIHLGPAVEKHEDGPLSTYFARFGKGESAALPAPYAEVWVVMEGSITVRSGDHIITAVAGDFLHVPEYSPGNMSADEDTEMVCISVPAH